MGAALLKAAAAFGVAVLLARLVVRPLFALLARGRGDEVFTATALLVALGAGWATGAVGLSLTLGAFLGGMIIAETPYRAIIQSEVRPFRGLLLGFSSFLLDCPSPRGAGGGVAGGDRRRCPPCGGQDPEQRRREPHVPLVRARLYQLGFLLAQGSEFAFVVLSLPSMRALVGERRAPCSLLPSR
jgi:CPA2 family monovalent cation:H+ antiporter-2